MSDTPNMLRGEFYSTRFVARCHDFKQCPLCKMCENFCQHSTKCVVCEARKKPVRKCECTVSQRAAVKLIQERLKMPLFDPNMRKDQQGQVMVADTSQMADWDSLVAELGLDAKEQTK